MQFADPQARSTAYLILRHLYDGDVIDWPIADDHPLRAIFEALESEGFVARWDRVWPLHDRYRLTEKGIATIEQVYKPAGAEAFFDDLQNRNLSPPARRQHLLSLGLDPVLWPLLHDPSTHWSNYVTVGARWLAYVWEDQRPPKPSRSDAKARAKAAAKAAARPVAQPIRPRQHLVDLDREADDDDFGVAPLRPDYDVS